MYGNDNYGVRRPDANSVISMDCCLCGEKMNVKRNVQGPRGFAAAMAGSKSSYDEFTCPNAQTDWHIHAGELTEYLTSIPSLRLKSIVNEELRLTLHNKKIPKGLDIVLAVDAV